MPISNPPPGAPVPPILPPRDGYLFLYKTKFHAAFAADVDAERAAFMADPQVPWGVNAPSGKIGEPAWKTKPSCSHAIHGLQPVSISALIAHAAKSVKAAAHN